MDKREKAKLLQNLPACAADFIKLIIKKMRYRKKVRAEVLAELANHFEDELKDCKTEEEKDKKAKQLITRFGDAKLLGVLLRRAKKRCRPLWRTIAARAFQTIGVLILCFILYLAWFLTGKPVITIDYVAELNRIARPVADDTLNAAPLYEKAVLLYKERTTDEISELSRKKYRKVTPEQKQLIEKWLADNKEIFDLVIAGTHKPYYWPKYDTGEDQSGEMMAVLLPNLAEFRRLAYCFRWHTWLKAEQGRYDDAFDNMKSCYRFGQHLRGDKTLIEQLVGIAMEALAVITVRDILNEYQIDSAILAKLQRDFEKIIAGEDFVVSLRTEKLCMYDEIQRCFTKDHFGRGHLYLQRLRSFRGFTSQDDRDLLEIIIEIRDWRTPLHILFTHPNKQETREMADRYYTFWDNIAHKNPGQLRAEGIDVEEEAMEIIEGNMLLEIMTPALSRVNELSHRLKTDVQATLTIIALLRYNRDTGSYPDSLEELITAGYLQKLPIDLYSNKPLVYKKKDAHFTLYSLGADFDDDDGQIFRTDKGTVRVWGDQGDLVFWPVPK